MIGSIVIEQFDYKNAMPSLRVEIRHPNGQTVKKGTLIFPLKDVKGNQVNTEDRGRYACIRHAFRLLRDATSGDLVSMSGLALDGMNLNPTDFGVLPRS